MRRLPAILLVTVALVAAMLASAPAGASPAHDRQLDGPHFPQSITTTVPPGGYAALTSPTIPRGATTLQIDLVARANATEPEVEAFDGLATVFGKMTKGKRLVTCVLLYHAFVTQSQAEDDYDAPVTFQVNEAAAALAVLVSCVRLAGLVTSTDPAPSAAGPAPRRASAGMHKCSRDNPGVPGTLEKSGDGWELSVDGKLAATRSKLKVDCRTKSGKTVLKVRAAKKGLPLRKVMGKRPRLSLFNPHDAETSAPTKVTFRLP